MHLPDSLHIRLGWKRIAAGLLALVLAAGSMLLLIAWLGLYNVAASTGHWAIVEWFLRFGMERSVKARASDAPAPMLDRDMARLGAGHFWSGCAYCHGAPGTSIGPVAFSMLPPPPDLSGRIHEWTDQELFWIVKHGFKYTGMPSWPAIERDDEVWAMVAFLRQLPELDEASYRALASGEINTEPQSGREAAMGLSDDDAVRACARCHGAEDLPASALVPTLHGQPPERLFQALRDYARGERRSGVMQQAASGLSEALMLRLATFYAGLPAPRKPRDSRIDPERILRGRQIAEAGDARAEVPACNSCHAAGSAPLFPKLAGQPQRYLEGQLKTWQAGLNDRSATGAIMAPIARRLNATQIADVAAYFASQPPVGGTSP